MPAKFVYHKGRIGQLHTLQINDLLYFIGQNSSRKAIAVALLCFRDLKKLSAQVVEVLR